MTVIRLFESGIIDADADAVWVVLRDFTSAPKWSKEITVCVMENGASPSQVGGVRRMTFDFGAVALERLVALSDRERFFEYELLPPEELPFRGYLGKMQVVPLSGSLKSVVQWSSSFTVEDANPEEVGRQLGQAYMSGLEGLRIYLASL